MVTRAGLGLRRLPSRLGRSPLIEAAFDVRFVPANAGAAEILTGYLFAKFGGFALAEKTPYSDIPNQVRELDINLKYAPVTRLMGKPVCMLIGPRSVTVSCLAPYIGWAAFRVQILKMIEILVESKQAESLERYSLKYVDLIPAEHPSVGALSVRLEVGDRTLSTEPTDFRTEFEIDGITNLVHIGSPAQYAPSGVARRSGLGVDIDSILQGQAASEAGFEGIERRLDDLHQINKQLFFALLTGETETSLEPQYE